MAYIKQIVCCGTISPTKCPTTAMATEGWDDDVSERFQALSFMDRNGKGRLCAAVYKYGFYEKNRRRQTC